MAVVFTLMIPEQVLQYDSERCHIKNENSAAVAYFLIGQLHYIGFSVTFPSY